MLMNASIHRIFLMKLLGSEQLPNNKEKGDIDESEKKIFRWTGNGFVRSGIIDRMWK